MASAAPGTFPRPPSSRGYSRREVHADAAVHAIGLAASVIAVTALLIAVIPEHRPLPIVAAAVYGFGLVAMLGASAAYNLVSSPARREWLRRLDHAAIYLMIAGTYTPFALVAFDPVTGRPLLALVWGVAALGIFLKLRYPRRFERAALALYLALGWAALPLIGQMLIDIPAAVLLLLGIGGLLYTTGVAFHLWERLPFQNAVWHGFVVAAAACHYAAVAGVLVA